jgi:hypothetical protein
MDQKHESLENIVTDAKRALQCQPGPPRDELCDRLLGESIPWLVDQVLKGWQVAEAARRFRRESEPAIMLYYAHGLSLPDPGDVATLDETLDALDECQAKGHNA